MQLHHCMHSREDTHRWHDTKGLSLHIRDATCVNHYVADIPLLVTSSQALN